MSLQRTLRILFDRTFTVTERRELSADLGITYDSTPGTEQNQKIIGFLISAYKNQKLDELHNILSEERPEIDWPALDELKAIDWQAAEKILPFK